jgi:hypothetical protein
MKKLFFLLLTIASLSLVAPAARAQCPMCKASVEAEHNNGTSELARGLNNGILYLFVLPYGGIAILAFIWYRKTRREKWRHVDEQ